MRSPLEHKPEFVQLLGLITIRWAVLEQGLAELLGQFAKTPHIGASLYYSTGTFRQRLKLINYSIRSGLEEQRHKDICLHLTGRIGNIWDARNNLIHSHYIYRITDELGHLDLHMEGTELMENLEEMPAASVSTGGKVRPSKEKSRSFGYLTYRPDGTVKNFKPVNSGTFKNHIFALSKRTRQTERLINAIKRGRVPIVGPQT